MLPALHPALLGVASGTALKVAGQIGKPGEQGRCLPKNLRRQALRESLHLLRDVQRGDASASHLARHGGCHRAAELRCLDRAG